MCYLRLCVMQRGRVIFSFLWDNCHKHCTRDSFHYLHSPPHTHPGLNIETGALTLAVLCCHTGTPCPVSPLCWGLSSSLMTNSGLDRLPAALHSLPWIKSPSATCFTSLSGRILSISTVLRGIYNAWAACRWELEGYFRVINGGVLHIHSRQH